MTERPLLISTQIATPFQAAYSAPALISANDARPVAESAEEEPYTIKCICDYSDDDGNTIYCEICDTWQHIECFYPGQVDDASREEFDHSCADCKPRTLTLDRRHATERQRQQRQNKTVNDSPDRKTKRPPSKSHKKKTKPSELQVNGHHDHDGHKHGSPPPHPKKSKGHRSHQSISSQVKRSPPVPSRPAHPPSPVHTPPDLPNNFEVHGYSERFLTLYDDDRSTRTTDCNSFANLSVSNLMATWIHDPETLQADTGMKKEDILQFLKVPVNSLRWPALRVERREETVNGTLLIRRCLINSAHITGTLPVGELNGLIGFQKDYCSDVDNRWAEAAHPRPFVFFLPHLPLFLDTRNEGSLCRYARRSCRPNTALDIFIAQGSEYHFWLTTDRPLSANEEVTMPWEFKFPAQLSSRYHRLLNLSDEEGAPSDGTEITDDDYDFLAPVVHMVLSDHGGCACNLGPDCAFVRFHRAYHGKTQIQLNGAKSKKGRKTKQNHVSPTSTGHATNSRAASEGQGDQMEEDDNRSVSGSTRSKPHSRDMTPLHSGEANGILTGNSEREKRKIAALEDSFRKMEQGQGQPPRKKKRASEGSNTGLPSHPTATSKPRQRSVAPRAPAPQAPGTVASGPRSHKYIDASTASRTQSGSPHSGISPTGVPRSPDNHASPGPLIAYRSRHSSTSPKPKYTESATQTDEVKNAWWNLPTLRPKRSIVSLSQRLLNNRRTLQRKQEAEACQQPVPAHGGEESRASPDTSMDIDSYEDGQKIDSPTDVKDRKMSIVSSTSNDIPGTNDIPIPDAPAPNPKPPPPTWPSQTTPSAGSHHPQKLPELRVQLPSVPVFTAHPLSGTPLSAAAQSPFGTAPSPSITPPGNGIGPSPVKTERKKLSLSDYKAAKAARAMKTDASSGNKNAPESSPIVAPAVLKPSLSTIEEASAQCGLDGSAIVDSPVAEKTMDPLAMAGPTSATEPNNTTALTTPSET
ncbi:hypothetical protein QTJ16_004655 [Diplocarpon rosae]|uniref:SET domain-containing protein n=1 Tax=Diplocarpon rosae TaxID=946125 RepID=A0AAD9SXK2_9HELO|nr:hypothetical protein QTJ16_004655 [Diplocarpon rosae]